MNKELICIGLIRSRMRCMLYNLESLKSLTNMTKVKNSWSKDSTEEVSSTITHLSWTIILTRMPYAELLFHYTIWTSRLLKISEQSTMNLTKPCIHKSIYLFNNKCLNQRWTISSEIHIQIRCFISIRKMETSSTTTKKKSTEESLLSNWRMPSWSTGLRSKKQERSHPLKKLSEVFKQRRDLSNRTLELLRKQRRRCGRKRETDWSKKPYRNNKRLKLILLHTSIVTNFIICTSPSLTSTRKSLTTPNQLMRLRRSSLKLTKRERIESLSKNRLKCKQMKRMIKNEKNYQIST